ncbi:hypothetical protein CKF54_03960 [Psittacicella hinzii]|uniref:Uncharacterized protein n=1 Tax=Psittacicella hinzii TaxID=2028575 RepID=A0A3A1Y6C9_9GAMM|nr:hypothetical protein CKF54_03960 [Psittacicella hinzii]
MFLVNALQALRLQNQQVPVTPIHWRQQLNASQVWQSFTKAHEVNFSQSKFTEVKLEFIQQLYQQESNLTWQAKLERLVLMWQLFSKLVDLEEEKSDE